MEQPYECYRDLPMFESNGHFSDDLARASRRANPLAWTLTQMMAGSFRLDHDNEWFTELSMLFLEIVRNDMSKAADLSDRM